jgi:hypothetical protein
MYYNVFAVQIYIINIFQNQIIFNFGIQESDNPFRLTLKI